MATQDKSFSVTFNINAEDVTFCYENNPVKYLTRKVFKVSRGVTKPLYWWFVFGAMISAGKLVFSPCVVELADGRIVLLECILETMCFRPRYDGLCVNLSDLSVTVERNIGSRVKQYLLDSKYDRPEMDR